MRDSAKHARQKPARHARLAAHNNPVTTTQTVATQDASQAATVTSIEIQTADKQQQQMSNDTH
jgi:hypothetical protein